MSQALLVMLAHFKLSSMPAAKLQAAAPGLCQQMSLGPQHCVASLKPTRSSFDRPRSSNVSARCSSANMNCINLRHAAGPGMAGAAYITIQNACKMSVAQMHAQCAGKHDWKAASKLHTPSGNASGRWAAGARVSRCLAQAIAWEACSQRQQSPARMLGRPGPRAGSRGRHPAPAGACILGS